MSDAPTDGVDAVPAEAVRLIGPYIRRGRELWNVQPLVSYFCYLYSAQLILDSKLHLQSEDVANYIEVLLSTVEENKKIIESSTPRLADILTDKEKSFNLVLGFALAIFNKAVEEVDGHVASKKTVQSFLAYLNFIEIVKLWPDLYETRLGDIQKQTKYAKYHSSRIMKALKANTDPNDYITATDEEAFSALMQAGPPDTTSGNTSDLISDHGSEGENPAGGLSLPQPPVDSPNPLDLPTTPVLIKGQKNILGLPSAPESEEEEASCAPPELPVKPVLPDKPSSQEVKPPQKAAPKACTPLVNQESKILTRKEVEKIWTKDDIISSAQRKAKFAISALNYEDIETAINELQGALKLLKGD